MKGLLKYLIISVLIVICSSCIFPYDEEITRYEDVLIIDGLLTDEPESSVVRLSRSIPVGLSRSLSYSSEEKPDSQATVFIKDDLGNVYPFYETSTSPGEYRSDNPDFRGIPGTNYQLYVITKDEQQYESDFMTLKKAPEIDSLYAEFGINQEDGSMEAGFNIYLDTYDPENSTRFYRFEYEETWEFTVPFESKYIIKNDQLVLRNEDVQRCWRTVPSIDIIIVSNERLESDVIQKFPIHFISFQTNRLGIRYSILVKQYSMSREAYAFWEQLKKSNQDQGTLFDIQPMQTIGNIYNIDDPKSPVIGFFEAASISEKRIFLTKADVLPGFKAKNEYEECRYKKTIVNKNNFDPARYSRYCILDYTAINEFETGIAMTWSFVCCDCTLFGSNIMPDFW
jgi:hypothetical protein